MSVLVLGRAHHRSASELGILLHSPGRELVLLFAEVRRQLVPLRVARNSKSAYQRMQNTQAEKLSWGRGTHRLPGRLCLRRRQQRELIPADRRRRTRMRERTRRRRTRGKEDKEEEDEEEDEEEATCARWQ